MAITQKYLDEILGKQDLLERAVQKNQPTISAQKPSNNALNAWSKGLEMLVSPLNIYSVNKNIPLVGGLTAADFVGANDVQSLAQDVSYGKPVVSGGSLQTSKFDPRLAALADFISMGGAATKGATLGAKELGKEALRQIETGTGIIGKGTIDPRMYVVKNEALDKSAKEYFGTTFYPQETGYIMDDLSRLDLSGRNQAAGYRNVAGRYIPESGQPDYLKMQRSVDHREVAPLLPSGERSGWENLSKFMDETGAIRYDADTGISLVNTNKPNPKQIEKVVNDFRRSKTPLIVDVDRASDGQNLASKEFENPTVEQVKRWINKQYKGLID